MHQNLISHNTPLCNRNVHIRAHFCYNEVHWHDSGIFFWCSIVGFVRWIYCLNSLKSIPEEYWSMYHNEIIKLPQQNKSQHNHVHINTLRPRQNGRHFADNIFKCIFLNENVWISIKISQKFIPTDLISNNPALVPIMAWRRPGNKPLSEPMTVSLPTHICVALPQWVIWDILYCSK